MFVLVDDLALEHGAKPTQQTIARCMSRHLTRILHWKRPIFDGGATHYQ